MWPGASFGISLRRADAASRLSSLVEVRLNHGIAALGLAGRVRGIVRIQAVLQFPGVGEAVGIGVFVRRALVFGIAADLADVGDDPLALGISDLAGADHLNDALVDRIAFGPRRAGVGEDVLVCVFRRLK